MHFILQHHTVKAVWLAMDGKKQLHKAAVTRFGTQMYTFRSFVADEVHILACMHSTVVKNWADSPAGLQHRALYYSLRT
eukprot:1307252-Rhodomonas_salina.1